MDELTIFGDGSIVAFTLQDGIWVRNPNYKPLHWVEFRWWGQFFYQGIDHRYESISHKPMWDNHFKPFSEN